MLCKLKQIDEGKWYCPVCDPDKKRLLPLDGAISCSNKPSLPTKSSKRGKKGRQKESMPPLSKQAWNLVTSLSDFVSDGMKLVPEEEYRARLTICDKCDHRVNNRCQKCGCKLSIKARGRAFKCPVAKWDVSAVPMPQTLVIILGLHASLSSCFAEMLQKLGVCMGFERDGNTPARSGEDKLLMDFCESLIPFPLAGETPSPEDTNATEGEEKHRKAVGEILFRLKNKAPVVGLKYPTLCAIPALPEYVSNYLSTPGRNHSHALAMPAGTVKYISLERPIEDSIKSLVDRCERAGPKAKYYGTPNQCNTLQRWLDGHRRDFLNNRPNTNHLTVDVAELVRRPGQTIDQVCKYIGLAPHPAQRQAAIAHISPEKAEHMPSSVKADTEFQVLVKSFRRPECLLRCLRSIRDYYPSVPILVADDSLKEGEKHSWEMERCMKVPGVRWYQLPFDTGLAEGRNYLIRKATSPYFLLLDDDCIVTEKTCVEKVISVLEQSDYIGIAGVTKTNGGPEEHWSGTLLIEEVRGKKFVSINQLETPWETIAGLQVRESDVTWNVFVARREVLLKHPWDPQFKIDKEHLDWMLEKKLAGLKWGYSSDLLIEQWRQDSTAYKSFRKRFMMKEFLAKWGFTEKPRVKVVAEKVGYTAIHTSVMMPKFIHQIWLGANPLPKKYQRFLDSWKALHPDWEHILWTEEKLKSRLPENLQNFYDRSPTYSQRSDIVRYWLLRDFGGVYFDTDYEPLQSITQLLTGCPAFVAQCNSKGQYASGAIGSMPKHPFAEALLKEIPKRFNPTKPLSLSPSLVTAAQEGRTDIARFPQSTFLPVEWKHDGSHKQQLEDQVLFPGSYAVHHFAESWKTEGGSI